jgi:hypothetical protein
MKTLQDLGLKDEVLPGGGETLDDLPTFGTFEPPPPPGTYVFQLPPTLPFEAFDVFDYPTGGGQRIRVEFSQDYPLTIVEARDAHLVGTRFDCRISNAERPRGRDKIIVSDAQYLLRALGETVKPAANKAYILAIQKHAGQQFRADISWSWNCRKDANIRMVGTDGQPVEVDQLGCGKRYYDRQVPRNADGTLPERIGCECGATLRAFANLDNIRAR